MNEYEFDLGLDDEDINERPEGKRNADERLIGDENLKVSFRSVALLDKETYKKTGEKHYLNHTFVKIDVPTDALAGFHDFATDTHIWRFPKEYREFLNSRQTVVDGTSLKVLKALTPAQIMTLVSRGINSVEDAAEMSPGLMAAIPDGAAYQAMAEKFLARESSKTIDAEKVALSKKNAELEAKLMALEGKAATLSAALADKAKKGEATE